MSLSSDRPNFRESIARPNSDLANLRRWAYEQTSDHSTTDRRIKAATQIVAYVLGKDQEPEQPNES